MNLFFVSLPWKLVNPYYRKLDNSYYRNSHQIHEIPRQCLNNSLISCSTAITISSSLFSVSIQQTSANSVFGTNCTIYLLCSVWESSLTIFESFSPCSHADLGIQPFHLNHSTYWILLVLGWVSHDWDNVWPRKS